MQKTFAGALLFLLMIPHGWAQSLEVAPPSGNWNKVQSLPTNTNITLELKYGEEVNGEFVRLADDSIVVKEFEREKAFPKNAVALIKWMKPGSRARNAAIIGGISLGVGFGLGYVGASNLTDQNDPPAGERAMAGVFLGFLLGGEAAAIALAYRPGLRGGVIYKARQP
jgi:hypothetical protein